MILSSGAKYNQINFSKNHVSGNARKIGVTVIWWFTDDQIYYQALQTLLDAINKEKPDAVLFNWKSISEAGIVHEGIHPIKTEIITSGRELYLQEYINMAPWCYIYKRGFLMEKQIEFPIDFKTCEDIQFNQKALFFASKVLALPIVGYLYRDMNVSATKGREHRVAQDQIRRLESEINYFSAYNDSQFLFEIVYRNLREINVWLAKCNPDEEMYIAIKNILRTYRLPFAFSYKSLLIIMMTTVPKLACKMQEMVHRIRLVVYYRKY